MTDKVTPTQADIDAAKAFRRWFRADLNEPNLSLEERFARHASQARAEGLAEDKLIGARLMQEASVRLLKGTGEAHWIRALSPAAVVKGPTNAG